MEKIPYGTAKIKILKTKQGEYGLHGDMHWDAEPYWEYYSAWIISTQAYGSVKLHSTYGGTAKTPTKINILELKLINESWNKAQKIEGEALELAIDLEKQGFRVDLEFGEEYRPQKLGKTWTLAEASTQALAKVRTPLTEDLYVELKGGEEK